MQRKLWPYLTGRVNHGSFLFSKLTTSTTQDQVLIYLLLLLGQYTPWPHRFLWLQGIYLTSTQIKKLSGKFLGIVINSPINNTLKQYNSAFRAWWEYCQRRRLSLFKCEPSERFSFLQETVNTKESFYNTLNTTVQRWHWFFQMIQITTLRKRFPERNKKTLTTATQEPYNLEPRRGNELLKAVIHY